ncbi:hypothetical protein GE061_018421 [Apolygus lucorum]|uniref:G-protein coupled receptors family 2 profile 2 domain-containing protein n=1 Tax=Apolygus lucorum TaxID=248454 RepID=A0A6A4JCW5_APOLU|nr:hypothetical protein GE061_018421 [Apolygus lucorum]
MKVVVLFLVWTLSSFLGLGSVSGDKNLIPVCCGSNTLSAYPACNESYPSSTILHWPDLPTRFHPLSCSHSISIEQDIYTQTLFSIDQEGDLVVYPGNNDFCLIGSPNNQLDYCLDYDLSKNLSVAHVCLPFEYDTHIAQKIGSPVSAAFLIITIATYLLKKSPKWSNGAYLISQATALACGFLCLARLEFFPKGCYQCSLAGFSLQYFFLAGFFWMNAQCVYIYLITTRLQLQSGSPARDDMRKSRFIRASVYAWGLPLIICSTTFILQYFDVVRDRRFRPDIGVYLDDCFLNGWRAKWIYFYAPMAVIVMANVVLFSLTYDFLVKHKSALANIRSTETVFQRNLRYYKQHMIFFICTGINWALEVIGTTFRDGQSENWKDTAWLVIDIFNSLQGVLILLMFIHPFKGKQTVSKSQNRVVKFKKGGGNESMTLMAPNLVIETV